MSVLEKIFATKREEVEAAKTKIPLSELEALAKLAPPTRGFKSALQNFDGLALIAEVKKASPSQGIIRADFDPVEIAKTYEGAGAQCLSILTDTPYFQGSPEFLTAARTAVGLPCLRKDFLYDPYQIYEARAWHADAVLLIAASLSTEQMRELRELAELLGMDALVEVHNEPEVESALASGASLIGVNNRDLSTFETDLSISESLLPLITPHATAVSESALETHADLARMAAAGAKAVLIGTTFTRSPDIAGKVSEVLGR